MTLIQKYAAACEQARESCLRSASFLGLGLYSTQEDSSQAPVLSKELTKARLPDGITPEDFDKFQSEYKSWVISHGLKELLKGLSLYFDQIYEYTLLASKKGGLVDADSAQKIKLMREKDLLGKQRALLADFGIASDHLKHLTTISKANDCMQRFKGKVSERYYNAGDSMKVSWCVLSSTKTKQKKYLTREKKFKSGKRITFKIKELLELGIFACILCDSIHDCAVKIEKARGLDS